MSFKPLIFAVCLAAAPSLALAQGTVRGAAEGADAGADAAGPVGAVVGGAVGAATGTVGGVVGVHDHGCTSRSVHREDSDGNSQTVRHTNCD